MMLLLFRFLELDEGVIRIDDVDIARLTLKQLRGAIAMLPQVRDTNTTHTGTQSPSFSECRCTMGRLTKLITKPLCDCRIRHSLAAL